MNHIMLDLETMSTEPNAAIVAIGAVRFDAEKITHRFYETVDLSDAVAHGLHMDANTVMWWLKQSDAARAELTGRQGHPLPYALKRLTGWVGDPKAAEVWGNGSDFDNVILASAYHAIGEPAPWKFYNNRCYRTMKSLFPTDKPERKGTAHSAIDDAVFQVEHLQLILRQHGVKL